MNFLCYLGGWALYRIFKWMGWLFASRKKGEAVTVLSYFSVYGPLIIRDLIVQFVIGLAWATGMLNHILTTALTTAGLTMPQNMTSADARAFAALVGYVVASVLSGVIMHKLTTGKPQEANGDDQI